ncbi:MAG: hypothetical protein IJU23_09250 [Proteobacteria bacterium]|nr:hypothetical protein [Pseudomonadota bacterium]
MKKLYFVSFISLLLLTVTGCHGKNNVNTAATTDAGAMPAVGADWGDWVPGYSGDDGNETDGNSVDNLYECGSPLCEPGSACKTGFCYKHGEYENNASEDVFYCNDPKGCNCGSRNAVCPKGAVCIIESDPDLSAVSYRCHKVDADINNASEVLEAIAYDAIYEPEPNNVIFHEEYFSKDDVLKRKNYILYMMNGVDYNETSVICTDPGCDCRGEPLKPGYLCVERHVVFDRADSEKDSWEYSEYGVCPKPYKTKCKYGDFCGHCDIAEDVAEQVCFNEKGCACGDGVIPKGDVCKDGHAQCSSTHSRPGCSCGDKVLEPGYGCYSSRFICQADETCDCHGTNIHRGDICEKDRIICGANARTPGCLCGEKTLRDGYRCFQKSQTCDCEGEDCKCACGNAQIARNAVCRDDDTPLVVNAYKHEDAERGDILICGNDRVSLMPHRDLFNGLYYMNIDDPEDQEIMCKCGTAMSYPGEDYACAFKGSTVGSGCEWTMVSTLAGWQCQRFEGCQCGASKCDPGDICDIDQDGTKSCKKFLTFEGECGAHTLPPTTIGNGGYACYDPYPPKKAPGWYCNKTEGCECGNIKCEYLQSCQTPGNCGEKLEQSDVEYLEKPVIDREEGDV